MLTGTCKSHSTFWTQQGLVFPSTRECNLHATSTCRASGQLRAGLFFAAEFWEGSGSFGKFVTTLVTPKFKKLLRFAWVQHSGRYRFRRAFNY